MIWDTVNMPNYQKPWNPTNENETNHHKKVEKWKSLVKTGQDGMKQ